jgi:hypothetical protein
MTACAGCAATAKPERHPAPPHHVLTGLPKRWHLLTVSGTPARHYILCRPCTRRVLHALNAAGHEPVLERNPA